MRSCRLVTSCAQTVHMTQPCGCLSEPVLSIIYFCSCNSSYGCVALKDKIRYLWLVGHVSCTLCLTTRWPDRIATMYYRVLHGSSPRQLQLQLRQQLLYQFQIASMSTRQLQSLALHGPICQRPSSTVASIFGTPLQLQSQSLIRLSQPALSPGPFHL